MIRHAAITPILSALLLGAGSISAAQQQAPKAAPIAPPAAVAAPPAAQSGDVDSIDHILAAVYDVISGPAGPGDWDRFRSLFFAGARLIPSWRDDKGNIKSRILSPDEYAGKASSRHRLPTAWNLGITWRTFGAPMNPGTPRARSHSRGASTVFSSFSTGRVGGSLTFIGKAKRRATRCRENT